MHYTFLDVAVSPIEEFVYAARNSSLPIVLVIAGVIAVVSLTIFFIKNRNKKDKQNQQE